MQCSLQEQYLHKDMNIFVKDTDLKTDNEIITKIHRLFLERIRKETGKSMKHWCFKRHYRPVIFRSTIRCYFAEKEQSG